MEQAGQTKLDEVWKEEESMSSGNGFLAREINQTTMTGTTTPNASKETTSGSYQHSNLNF